MNTYEIDTAVQMASNFTNASGTPTDPSSVTLYILQPNGTETTVPQSSLTHVSTGVWTYVITANQSGGWLYKFQGAGTLVATSPDTVFIVNSSRVIAG